MSCPVASPAPPPSQLSPLQLQMEAEPPQLAPLRVEEQLFDTEVHLVYCASVLASFLLMSDSHLY